MKKWFRSAPVSKRSAYFYVLLAAITIPWTAYIAVQLPENNLSAHWDVAWVGFDVGLVSLIIYTAWCAYRESIYLPFAAVGTATMLVIDAWFDSVTAAGQPQFDQSLMLAVFVELPLAVLTMRVALRAINKPLP